MRIETVAKSDEIKAVRGVVQAYVEAARTGDAGTLENLFHPQALMTGHIRDRLLLGTPAPFFAAVRAAPAPAASGEAYRAEIVNVEVAGSVASVTLKERHYLGTNFTDFFHLLRLDGEWRIVSKTFDPS
ncbi:MAG: nuclear transport factor 2 family protein [Gammaproteobacteria bacterium]|nr:nuclear transport factor 2 family protein [Gammaproteobacteria bacterium]